MLTIILHLGECALVLNIRAFPIEEEQNREFSKVKLQMPVLVLGGEHSFGTAALVSMKLLATNVSGGIVPFSGH